MIHSSGRCLSILVILIFALLVEALFFCSTNFSELINGNTSKNATPPADTDSVHSKTFGVVSVYTYKIVNTYPHDKKAFTQGLVFEDEVLYEGTGLRGQSTLRKTELETGSILQIHKLPAQFFGEGITVHANRIIQLTWQSNVGFAYDKAGFRLLEMFKYPTEGWGITHDERRLIMSDGTSILRFLDPETFEETGHIQVYDGNGPVTRLNELEYVKGEIYANTWTTDRIARIAPQTGQVVGWIDLKGLLRPEDRTHSVGVLNGIAYDADNDRLFVTGKFWPKLFEIELVPMNQCRITDTRYDRD